MFSIFVRLRFVHAFLIALMTFSAASRPVM